MEIVKILPSKDKTTTTTTTTTGTKYATIIPVDPIGFKFPYAKENQKFEIHMELEWTQK